jgi:L-lactate dehydrogenase complex protein LldE
MVQVRGKQITVDIHIPCLTDQLHPQSGFNMVKVLEYLECKVNYDVEQTCCGMPAFTNGNFDDAKLIGEKFIREFQYDRHAVSLSGGCVGTVRDWYTRLFNNSMLHNPCKRLQKNLHEVCEFIVDVLKKEDLGLSLDAKVCYHDSCQSLKCGIKSAPRTLLKNIKGMELIEMSRPEECCGFGGFFATDYEAISVSLAEQKINDALQTGASYIVSNDPGCLMQLETYINHKNLSLKPVHVIDLLAMAIG